ncbi:hypothetical protein DFP93_106120 [Aneurinibacillus soli]|uniref:Uncharacterized protein n=1 Tax=Aneurinibacillus soli TaxID=1500254 RepID=A0A0U5B5S2_9BACL|nr:hypothetical protein [Aneurinibacillus soli]PYE61927.1 hypothetical protein DFP93_106120 [Aneurinibacillus soli]BAU29744.1 hypothetical protein CB4_03981 [Aneurinibacillus soli]
MANNLKGRIVEIEKNVHKAGYLTQGIKKSKQRMYERDKNTLGSNGSYVTGFEYYGTTIDIKIFVYDYEKCIKLDIRDYILRQNGKKKVSSKLLDYVIKNNKGKKVVLEEINRAIYFDQSQLDVKMS